MKFEFIGTTRKLNNSLPWKRIVSPRFRIRRPSEKQREGQAHNCILCEVYYAQVISSLISKSEFIVLQ